MIEIQNAKIKSPVSPFSQVQTLAGVIVQITEHDDKSKLQIRAELLLGTLINEKLFRAGKRARTGENN